MSLLVWLPLNGNIDNYGLINPTFTNSGATVNNNGKIGKCYEFVDTSHTYIRFNTNETLLNTINNHSFSVCAWIKTTTNRCWLSMTYAYRFYATLAYMPSNNITGNNTPIDGNWHHVCVTHDHQTLKNTFYVDGVSVATTTGSAAAATQYTNASDVGHDVNSSATDGFYFTGLINDVRIYDHCLSQQEIHEISKALVLHYKLDDKTVFSNNNNLIMNGWGGTENWQNSNVFTTELPTGLSPAPTHSYKNNSTKQFIKINPNHSYTISGYVKSYNNNYSYLALVPYDIDKLQINNYNTASGFKSQTLTTLKEPLCPGDTVIYLADSTDMTKWVSTSINTQYANLVALFGYKDSTGHVYPDLYYTRRTYSYRSTASGVDVTTNIDATNKTVTLLNPYSGKETIPAGTSICLTTQGAGYYYPITATPANSQDWTLITKTFTPSTVTFLNGVNYVKYIAMSQNWVAAITLVDNDANNIVHDCSGYGNNGQITGTLSFADDTPRYNTATIFPTTNPVTKMTTPLTIDKNNWTICYWKKCDWNDTTYNAMYSILWNYIRIRKYSRRERVLYYYLDSENASVNIQPYIMAARTDSEWMHCAITFDGTTIRCYSNGSYYTSGTLVEGGTLRADSATGSFVLNYSGNGTTSPDIQNCFSDVRVYATTLSADDILDLYNSSGNVDDNGNISFYEYEEKSHNMLFDQNIGILTKTWVAGLSKYNQTHCQCTLTDDGYRIYRTPNLTYPDAGSVMWGGFVIDNTNNRLNLQDNHTYLLQFEIKGQTSNNVSDIYWTNYVGWGGGETAPTPSGIKTYNPVTTDYNSSEWRTFTYKWTISDTVYKLCTSSYQSFEAGKSYVAYKGFKYGFTYKSTGTLGTDLYIKNIRMFDITNDVEIELNKEGIMVSKFSVDEPTFKEMDLGGLKFGQFIEY